MSIKPGEVLDTLTASDPPTLIGSFPTKTAANFRYSAKSGYLVFSDYVWPDGNLSTVQEQDKNWEDRGNTAYVYDTTYERHWDTWVGRKRPALFSVKVVQDSNRKWVLGKDFYSPLRGTGHVCVLFIPIGLVNGYLAMSCRTFWRN